MILVDTSVWIDHLRQSESKLVDLLEDGLVMIHPFIIEELACGSISRREDFLELLDALPKAKVAKHREVLNLIAREKLSGTGLGSVDVHLIASAMLSNASLWSKDKALSREARRLAIEA
jgi:hypothetical protein